MLGKASKLRRRAHSRPCIILCEVRSQGSRGPRTPMPRPLALKRRGWIMRVRVRMSRAEGAGHMTTILCERMKKMACLKVIVVLLAVFATGSVAGPVPLVLWHGMGEWKHHYEIVQRQIFHDHFCNFVCSPLQVTAVASRSVWVT